MTLFALNEMLFSISTSAEPVEKLMAYPAPPGWAQAASWTYESRISTRNESSTAKPSSCQTVLSMLFAQHWEHHWKRSCPLSPPIIFRLSTPAFFVNGYP